MPVLRLMRSISRSVFRDVFPFTSGIGTITGYFRSVAFSITAGIWLTMRSVTRMAVRSGFSRSSRTRFSASPALPTEWASPSPASLKHATVFLSATRTILPMDFVFLRGFCSTSIFLLPNKTEGRCRKLRCNADTSSNEEGIGVHLTLFALLGSFAFLLNSFGYEYADFGEYQKRQENERFSHYTRFRVNYGNHDDKPSVQVFSVFCDVLGFQNANFDKQNNVYRKSENQAAQKKAKPDRGKKR